MSFAKPVVTRNGLIIAIMFLIGVAYSSNIYAEDQKYLPVDPSELYFEFMAKLKSVEVDSDDNIKNINGKVALFKFQGEAIDLKTNDIVLEGNEAFIHTNKYGKIKFTMKSNFQATLWLMNEQKNEFLKLMKNR